MGFRFVEKRLSDGLGANFWPLRWHVLQTAFFRDGGPPVRFFGPEKSFFAERIVYSRRESKVSKVSKVLVRIQYALFVALFVLMSAVGPLPEREGSDRTFAALSADRSSDIPSPADFCFAVPCLGFEISDLPDSGCGLRSLLRCYDFGSAGSALTVSDAAGAFVPPCGEGFSPRPVDYYVFSLERIRI